MRKTWLALTLVCLAAPLFAQGPSAVGTWKLNLKKSTFGKMPAPKSETLTITQDDDKGIKWHTKRVGADGKVISESFAGAYDGKAQPVKGSDQLATAAFSKAADGIHIAWKMKDGTTMNSVSTMDGNTLTDKSPDVTWVWERAAASASGAKPAEKKPAAKK